MERRFVVRPLVEALAPQRIGGLRAAGLGGRRDDAAARPAHLHGEAGETPRKRARITAQNRQGTAEQRPALFPGRDGAELQDGRCGEVRRARDRDGEARERAPRPDHAEEGVAARLGEVLDERGAVVEVEHEARVGDPGPVVAQGQRRPADRMRSRDVAHEPQARLGVAQRQRLDGGRPRRGGLDAPARRQSAGAARRRRGRGPAQGRALSAGPRSASTLNRYCP